VRIPSGTTAVDIGQLLEQAGVIDDGAGFREYAKAQGEGAEFKAGTYRFRAGTDYDAIIQRLDAGPPAPRVAKLVLPEGFRLTEIEARVAALGMSRGAYRRAVARATPPAGFPQASSPEGFVFPATYDVRPNEPARELVAAQVAAFRRAFRHVDLRYARAHNLTPYDVLIIASMIEREAHVPRDRRLISAVIYNRLRRGMSLGIDATLLYALGSWTATIHQSDIDRDGPYNTRKRLGLPPTPICSPGLASLRAAAHPAPVDYLYYVVKPGTGAHYFTDSYRDFLAHQPG
jgi:UPF0755 protein